MSIKINNPKKLGISVAGLNIFFTMIALGIMMRRSDVLGAREDSPSYWLWIIVYSLDLLLNAYLLWCMLKRDRFGIVVWLPLTVILLVCRVYSDATYGFLDLIITVYIFISIVLMAIVFYKLRQQSLRLIEPTLHTITTNVTTTHTIIKPNNVTTAKTIIKPDNDQNNRDSEAGGNN
ncbi:uncharacterized protein LOC111602337 [Drosophila hydei]|uniref:Uncharacterized protein LOC111602337 n=1 Tax=Drosophila hydei TaxID=7224 RepID=A0A6J1M7E4_DROHY|nr:uncharacterized protein LOC111602337 [Drosophila hydei]